MRSMGDTSPDEAWGPGQRSEPLAKLRAGQEGVEGRSILVLVSSNPSLLPGPPIVRAQPTATAQGTLLEMFTGPASGNTEQGRKGQRLDLEKQRITRLGRNPFWRIHNNLFTFGKL